ncbi:DEAD/DEAH box helicase [Candidatus Dependentiae bacterium]
MGFETATPIQALAIPQLIEGHDVIGQASTGTGKTAAFMLPAIEKIDESNKSTQVLVLCPTRELAMQVAVETNKFLKYKSKIKAVAVYGGQPIYRQLCALRRGAQIVVGTPGRTLDHIERGTLRLDKIKMMILDEADEMLNMGFRQDIEQVLKVTNTSRQTILFSATMSNDILRLTKRYQKNPKIIKVAAEKLSVKSIEQIYFDIEVSRKTDALMDLINSYKPKLSIVFCNTKRKVDKVCRVLNDTGFLAAGIHGDIKQTKRDRIMSRFRQGRVGILVATDVAARGIDVPNIDIVFNYEIPRDVEPYVHRIGRTGRAGKSGKALSLVSRSEFRQLCNIKRYTNTDIARHSINLLQSSKSDNVQQKDSFVSQKSDFVERTERRVERVARDERVGNSSLKTQKINKVLGRIKRNINSDELLEYLDLVEKFIDKKGSRSDFSQALFKRSDLR